MITQLAQQTGSARTATQEPPPHPAFLREVFLTYIAGDAHAFWLHGNLQDIDAKSWTLPNNLSSLFSGQEPKNESGYSRIKMDLFVVYNRATGFVLYGDDERGTRRQLFLDLLGTSAAPPQSAAAAMQARLAGGGSGGSDPLYDNRRPEQAIPLLHTLLSQHKQRICLIIESAQTLVPRGEWAALSPVATDTMLVLRKWGLDYAGIGQYVERTADGVKPMGHVIVGLTDNLADLHEYVRRDSGWHAIEVGKPAAPERLWYVRQKLDGTTPSYRSQVPIDVGVDRDQVAPWLAEAVAGLRMRDIESIFLAGRRNQRLDRTTVKDVVHRIIREQFTAEGGESFLDFLDPNFGLDRLGGYDYLVDYMRWRLRQFAQGKLGQRGFLLMGPPGTGKSSLAQALAFEAGYKAVEWKPALTKNKYVGETERQTSLALQFLKVLGKTLCLIEEVDVAMENRESLAGASGVGGSMLSLAMPFIADERQSGDILWVATTNDIDGVDEAMKRPGRLGVWVPMVPPHPSNLDAIAQIIQSILQREHGITAGAVPVPEEVLVNSAWFTQAHLQALVSKASDLADRQGMRFADDVAGYLRAASRRYRPNTRRVEQLSLLAIANCQEEELIPPGYTRPEAKEVVEMKKELAELAPPVLGPSGRL